MSRLLIEGNRRLNGEVLVQGAKNSILPILAATILCSGKCILHNCPDILDVDFSLKILKYLGATVQKSKNDIMVDTQNINRFDIPDFLMKEMRSSIVFLGALLGRFKKSEMCLPGGCELGPRPIDLHLKYLKTLGVLVNEFNGNIQCSVKSKIKGTQIRLPFPSVGATENVMLASVLGEGITIINNAAREPEICDLANFLNTCGAKIYGAGDSTLVIEGVKSVGGAEYTIIPDRIAAITFLAAGAITGGKVKLNSVNYKHFFSVIEVLKKAGCEIFYNSCEIYLKAPLTLKSVKKIVTAPYPFFPTDSQAIIMSVLTKAVGTSVFEERVFPKRYNHVLELKKLGASITLDSNVAFVKGVSNLKGTELCGYDLRGTAALIVAALGADGISYVTGLKHLDRGYQNLEESLLHLGANVSRL